MSEGKTFKIVDNDISDGYHTFDELYEHRCLLYLNFCLDNPQRCKWKYDENTPGWFILYYQTQKGQISYHLPDKLFRYISGIVEHSPNHQWDGHTSAQVLERLLP